MRLSVQSTRRLCLSLSNIASIAAVTNCSTSHALSPIRNTTSLPVAGKPVKKRNIKVRKLYLSPAYHKRHSVWVPRVYKGLDHMTVHYKPLILQHRPPYRFLLCVTQLIHQCTYGLKCSSVSYNIVTHTHIKLNPLSIPSIHTCCSPLNSRIFPALGPHLPQSRSPELTLPLVDS